MDYAIIWILSGAAVAFLVTFYMRKKRVINKEQKAHYEKVEEKKERYSHITSQQFDNIPQDELTHAILFHINAKEDQVYEGDVIKDLVDILTPGERLIYSIYEIDNSIQSTRNGSIHSYFIDQPFCQFRPYVIDALNECECFEAAKLMAAADHLATIIEEDKEDEDDDSDYSNYNFTDFTLEIASCLKSSNIVVKMAEYIRNHKEDFIDNDEDKTVENDSDLKDEYLKGDNNE